MTTKIKPVAIIGAGPAGIAAAMQLKRLDIEFLLFEQDVATGSLLKDAWNVENYPGTHSSISGIKLLKQFQQILIKNNIETINAKVLALDYDPYSDLFTIKTSKKQYSSYRAIIATGTKPKNLDLLKNLDPNLRPCIFNEVFTLLKKRGKNIAIIGAGDAAFDNALNLAKFNQVHIFNYATISRALPLLIKQALEHKNISYYENHELIGIDRLPKKSVATKLAAAGFSLRFLKNRRLKSATTSLSSKTKTLEFDYVITAIGREAQKDFYTEDLKLQEKKLLKVNKLFLIGDVKNNPYRQVAIATGDGILAAMQIMQIETP